MSGMLRYKGGQTFPAVRGAQELPTEVGGVGGRQGLAAWVRAPGPPLPAQPQGPFFGLSFSLPASVSQN